jgi:hypothetical protein
MSIKLSMARQENMFNHWELGLMVDFVKQGFGTTNDGNTARRFFGDPEKTAKITGLDAGLVRRFAILLQVIASKEQVAKFREHVHKLLIHGADNI